MEEYNEEVKNELMRLRENILKQNQHLGSIVLKLRKFIPNQIKTRISNIPNLPDSKELKKKQIELLKELSKTENVTGLAFSMGLATGRHETIQSLLLEDEKLFPQLTKK